MAKAKAAEAAEALGKWRCQKEAEDARMDLDG
jgi:hypothetical protein